jgi:hypothetical protein
MIGRVGFQNQFFNDSWVVGFLTAYHGRHDVALEDELGRWLKPFLDRLDHNARRRMCPRYVAGLIGPSERESECHSACKIDPLKVGLMRCSL